MLQARMPALRCSAGTSAHFSSSRPPRIPCIMGFRPRYATTHFHVSTFSNRPGMAMMQALSQAFEKHRRRLVVLVHFKLGPRAREFADAEDVVQETCLRAFRDIASFAYQSPGSFFRWLSAIADHVIVDRVRYQNRECRAGEEVRFPLREQPAGPRPVRHQNAQLACWPQREAVQRLLDRLDALPEDYRQAILMAKIERLSTAEMAERLGKSREAVALLVYRAVKRFRELSDRSEA